MRPAPHERHRRLRSGPPSRHHVREREVERQGQAHKFAKSSTFRRPDPETGCGHQVAESRRISGSPTDKRFAAWQRIIWTSTHASHEPNALAPDAGLLEIRLVRPKCCTSKTAPRPSRASPPAALGGLRHLKNHPSTHKNRDFCDVLQLGGHWKRSKPRTDHPMPTVKTVPDQSLCNNIRRHSQTEASLGCMHPCRKPPTTACGQ